MLTHIDGLSYSPSCLQLCFTFCFGYSLPSASALALVCACAVLGLLMFLAMELLGVRVTQVIIIES